MTREWKPGDVALVRMGHGPQVSIWTGEFWAWSKGDGPYEGVSHCHRSAVARPVVVIDPEGRAEIERLRDMTLRLLKEHVGDYEDDGFTPAELANAMQAAFRALAEPSPTEPTDATTRVTDRRENIWRLLADGEWVCTSGPDIGEYLTWDKLAAERGPLEVSS